MIYYGVAPEEGGMRRAMVRLSKALGHPEFVEADPGQCVEAALIEMAAERIATAGVPGLSEPQAAPIRDALRAVQEMWDELHRRGLNPQLMRRYNDAISVLERDFTERLPLDADGVPGCPESGKHCRVVEAECQTCGHVAGGAPTPPASYVTGDGDGFGHLAGVPPSEKGGA